MWILNAFLAGFLQINSKIDCDLNLKKEEEKKKHHLSGDSDDQYRTPSLSSITRDISCKREKKRKKKELCIESNKINIISSELPFSSASLTAILNSSQAQMPRQVFS